MPAGASASGGAPQPPASGFPAALIGASAHSAEEASALAERRRRLRTVSPVFLTVSKPGYGPALGTDRPRPHRRAG